MFGGGRLLTLRRVVRVVREARRPESAGFEERLAALPRLVAAVARGDYTGTTKSRLAMMAAGTAYVVSPVDLVPEGLLLAFGLVDDLGVAAWVAAQVLVETDRFLTWEREQARTVRGVVVPA